MVNTKNQSVFFKPLLISAAIVIIIFGLRASSSLIAPILFALLLTILIIPIIKRFERMGAPKWLAITTVCLVTVIIIWLLIGIFSVSLAKLSVQMPYYQEQLATQLAPLNQALLERGIDISSIVPADWLDGTSVIQGMVSFISSIISGSFSLFFFILTLIYMIVAADAFADKYTQKFGTDKTAKDILHWMGDIQRQFIIQTSNNLFTALSVGTAYFLLGIHFSALWAFLTFILAYIPNIGIVLASIPPIILAFIQFGLPTAVITLILIIILNQIMDSVVTPRMIGHGVQAPPLVVFISFMFWSWVLGPLGAILALPFTLAIRGVLSRVPSTQFAAQLLTQTDKTKQLALKKQHAARK